VTFKSVTIAAGAWLMPILFLVGLGVMLVVGHLVGWSLVTVFFTYSIGWLIGYVTDSFTEYYLEP
jgi:hypothetical protein